MLRLSSIIVLILLLGGLAACSPQPQQARAADNDAAEPEVSAADKTDSIAQDSTVEYPCSVPIRRPQPKK